MRNRRYNSEYRYEAPWETRSRLAERNRKIVKGVVAAGVGAAVIRVGYALVNSDTEQHILYPESITTGLGHADNPLSGHTDRPPLIADSGQSGSQENDPSQETTLERDIDLEEPAVEDRVEISSTEGEKDDSSIGRYRREIIGTLNVGWFGYSVINNQRIEYSPDEPETFEPFYDLLVSEGRYIALTSKELWGNSPSLESITTGRQFRELAVATSVKNELDKSGGNERIMNFFTSYYGIQPGSVPYGEVESFLEQFIFNAGFSPEAFYLNYGSYFNSVDGAYARYTRTDSTNNTHSEVVFNSWDEFKQDLVSNPVPYSDHEIFEIVQAFKNSLHPSDKESIYSAEGASLFGLLKLIDGQGDFYFALKEARTLNSDSTSGTEQPEGFSSIVENIQEIQTTPSPTFETQPNQGRPYEYPAMPKAGITFEVEKDFPYEPQIARGLLAENSLNHLIYPVAGQAIIGQDVGIPAPYQRY
ncbi:hypothetical protein KC622_03800, partial [Candidatus Dojkabacteria bacterium]|nr:hypothetical protein [Candidatus Dojkabacteria bacterium]